VSTLYPEFLIIPSLHSFLLIPSPSFIEVRIMLTLNRHSPRREGEQHSLSSSQDERRNAEAQGITIEVYRLQERLRKLPLVPREDWLRKKRDELVDKLFATARRDRCLSRINPWAARDTTVLPNSY
jgi:hypothetical protein